MNSDEESKTRPRFLYRPTDHQPAKIAHIVLTFKKYNHHNEAWLLKKMPVCFIISLHIFPKPRTHSLIYTTQGKNLCIVFFLEEEKQGCRYMCVHYYSREYHFMHTFGYSWRYLSYHTWTSVIRTFKPIAKLKLNSFPFSAYIGALLLPHHCWDKVFRKK